MAGQIVSPILHVVLSLDVGGAEMLVRRMACAYHAAGSEVVIACLDRAGDMAEVLQREGVRIVSFERHPVPIDLVLLKGLKRLISEVRPKIVHTHNFEANFYGSLAARLSGRFKVVHTQHGNVIPFTWKQKILMQISGCCTDRVVAVSNTIEEFARSNYWVRSTRLSTIINGVQLVDVDDREEVRFRIRNEFAIPGDALVIVNVARLASVKNHSMLLEAFSKLLSEGVDAYLFLLGDGDERGKIERQAVELGLTDKLRMVGQTNDVNAYLLASDVFVLCSHYEGVSVALLEAMSAELIPVVTAVGGNPNIVKHEKNGYVVGADDVEDLVDCLSFISKSLSSLTSIKSNARISVTSHYSFDGMLEQYLDQYLALLN